MRANVINNKFAVITGASSGIGAEVARHLAREGMRVALIARRAERLSALAAEIKTCGGWAVSIPADLTDETARARAFDEAGRLGGDAHLLVNNAGLGWYGYCAEMPWEVARDILRVNVEAVVQFSLLFLERMKQNNEGHIINIGSISGSLPSQGVALYGATKAFLDNFTTAMHRELRGLNVHASVVRAGPVQTEFCDTAARRKNGSPMPTERVGITSAAVAEAVLQLVRVPRRVAYIPRWMGIVPWLELGFGWLIDALGPLLLERRRQ